MIREISAGIIIYRKTSEGSKFLLLYHGRGYWNFPKGKIEHAKSAFPPKDSGKTSTGLSRMSAKAPIQITKETSFQAAVREVKEETGLSRSDLKLDERFKVYEKFTFWRRLGGNNVKVFKIVIFYLAETKNPVVRISKEHNGFGWFTYRETMKILGKYKDSQRVLTQAYEFLKKSFKER